MSDRISSAPTVTEPAEGVGDLCGAVVLDATGKVVAANRSARELWDADRKLVGMGFASLFNPHTSASEATENQAWWKALGAEAALDRWLTLTAHSLSGPTREVRVRIERALGGAGTYIATVLPLNG